MSKKSKKKKSERGGLFKQKACPSLVRAKGRKLMQKEILLYVKFNL